MPQKPTDKGSRGPLRALSDWLIGSTPPPQDATPAGSPGAPRPEAPARVGHYTITGRLGQGGMGVVYSARDDRLDRSVALKMMTSLAGDEAARKRFWREARAAAAVNHPNVCQLYDVGEDNGAPFIAMELLEGQVLTERLRGGPLRLTEVLPIAEGILAALGALHARGIVHRDLKPSNVFLTGHGVKVLDFGLARPSDQDLEVSWSSHSGITNTGMMVGTPRYMAPEQITGDATDARSDLFAVGAIVFEMLAGRPAFAGSNAVEILHATLHEQPPALTGSPAVAAVDRVIRKALAKKPDDRPASAETLAGELRTVAGLGGGDTPALARAMTRLVVLPFRMLRPDPETDFLAFSLPDAIATSLSRERSLVVRSSAMAARFAGPAPDLRALAGEADVDRVVMGTLLRAGEQLRASAQLVEAPGGTLLAAEDVQAPLGDLFRLQDDLARRLVKALVTPLAGAPPAPVMDSPTPAAPRNAHAYALYLRANELSRSYEQLPAARDLYQESLDLDPGFAPAWAQLGRCHRVIGKYVKASGDALERSEEALRRALEIDPGLALAHRYYAQLESDLGKTKDALVRLLKAASRHGNDAELFAGLVHACRYCGLFEQSLAAHEEATRLDPNVPTSFEQTILMTGDVDRLLTVRRVHAAGAGDAAIRVIGLGLAGRREDAYAALTEMSAASRLPAFGVWMQTLRAWLDRQPPNIWKGVAQLGALGIMEDPEAIFQAAWLLCDSGDLERGKVEVRRAVEKGYSVAPTLEGRPAFAGLRGDAQFEEVVRKARADCDAALAAFRANGGERLLGR